MCNMVGRIMYHKVVHVGVAEAMLKWLISVLNEVRMVNKKVMDMK